MISHTIAVEMTSHGRGRVLLDGEPLSVRSIRFESHVDGVNTVDLEVMPEQVTISGPAVVTTRERTKWAPTYFEFNSNRGARR